MRHKTVTDNPFLMIYIYRIEHRITFTIKARYHLQLLIPETIKLLGSTTKDKKGKNVAYLEITKVILVHCNTANNDWQ